MIVVTEMEPWRISEFGATWVGSKAALELIPLQNGMSDNNFFLKSLFFSLVDHPVYFYSFLNRLTEHCFCINLTVHNESVMLKK